MVENLLQEIEPNLKILSYRNNPISLKLQLLITLRYYATGSFQIVTSDLFSVSQSSISRIICRITHQIGNLAKQEIKVPATVNELSKLKVEFYIVGGIPHIIGIIDGTLILIQSVGGNNAESYRNRKSYFSINTQIICDVNMRILDINARWPGSCHDQMMFNFSKIRARFESGEFGESLLLGDSGYACRNYLLTPVLNPTTQKEISYNKGFIKTRLIVEQTIGVWKRRFPVLSTKMRLKTETAVAVIVATAVLHNRLKDRAVPEPDMTEFFVDGMNLETGNLRSMTSPSDFDKRNETINNFF